ncbi:MAG: hypothetical protein WCY93_12130 [Anaerolineaceae bacterium]
MQEVLKLFKAQVVSDKVNRSIIDYSLVEYGVVTDFIPDQEQVSLLIEEFKPLDMRTMWSKAELQNSTPEDLMAKQLAHYFLVYGLDHRNILLEFDGGKTVGFTFIRGITEAELQIKVQDLLYSNAPIMDVVALKAIIDRYGIRVDISKVKNNEARVILFDPTRDIFTNGDDAVRYIVYKATDELLLIKSKEVIEKVRNSEALPVNFFGLHARVLAQVFNRHKKILMASRKNRDLKSVINRIARMSKRDHVPIVPNLNSYFVNAALAGNLKRKQLSGVSTRSLFKGLNLLAYKKTQNPVDSFVVRNGKVWCQDGRPQHLIPTIERAERLILGELKNRLQPKLKSKTVLLDKWVDYGLPISRKQTVGQVPFGTEVTPDGRTISSGMYWENDWGARDLDLSTVDTRGNRTGWGYYNSGEIHFSGDVTNAPKGAMEFMTSSGAKPYGLFVNIYSGNQGCEMEVVAGSDGKDKWIGDLKFREKIKLNSRGMVIGFVRGNTYVAWMGRISNRAANFGENNPVIKRALCNQWTVKKLLDALDIDYLLETEEIVDHDLTYIGFSYDRLEELLLTD